MAAIKWEDKYLVNVETMDEQHKKLVEMINVFYAGVHQKDSENALQVLLKGLLDYTEYHFSTEETFMKKHEFPFRMHHVSEHDAFRAHMIDCYKRIQSKELVISYEITNYLRTWLLGHILASDKILGKYITGKGVS